MGSCEIESTNKVAIWRNCALDVAERILGLLDREAQSPTYGCFDRLFWKYFLTDFPSAWCQGSVEYLMWLYLFPGSRFYQNEKIGKWCEAGCDFICNWLNADGSVMEAYPFERSFCATSFLAGHYAKAASVIGLNKECFLKMATYLGGNFGGGVSNQIAAAALAQIRIGEILGEADISRDGILKLEALYSMQDVEGFFPEYGGLDVGYNSITISLMARIEQEFPGCIDPVRIEKAVGLFERILDGQGRYSYAKTTRKTQFIYPFGLAFFKPSLLKQIQKGLEANLIIRPSWLDDRYVAELAIDYCYTANLLVD